MAEFTLLFGRTVEGDAKAFTLEPNDRSAAPPDEMRFRRRLHGLQERLIELANSDGDLKYNNDWLGWRRWLFEQLRQTAENFVQDLISAEDAFLMTYIHQGYFEAMVANASMTGGGRTASGNPARQPTACNHPQCPRRLLPSSNSP